jgi:hypothetical protein
MESLILFNNKEIIFLFFKVFLLISSFLYFLFFLVTFQQTKVMIKTVEVEKSKILMFLSLFQLFLSIVLFFGAFFL